MHNTVRTLFDQVWDSDVVTKMEDGPDVLFIDRHFIHEVNSPVAFLGLESSGINVMFPERTFATADHNTPTVNQHLPGQDPLSSNQLKALERNAAKYGISHWGLGNPKNGIVHIMPWEITNSCQPERSRFLTLFIRITGTKFFAIRMNIQVLNRKQKIWRRKCS